MPEGPPPGAGEDSAWVSVATTLAPNSLLALLRDPLRLMQVNPMWIFDSWETTGPGEIRFRIDNQSNGQVWETTAHVMRLPDGLRLDYADGIKASTLFRVEPTENGSVLWIVDNYGRLSEAERRDRVAEVDRSLAAWGGALYRHLRAWSRWAAWPPWRWYVERQWLRMKPLSRRIVRLLIWVSVAELVLFALLVAILIAEGAG
jgi:hypothetical protein